MANRMRRGNKRSRRDEDDDVYMGQVEDDEYNAQRRRSSRKRRRKNKTYEGDADLTYKDGDVVWARLEDFPWWPARCEIEGEDQGYPFHVRVRWFGEDSNRADLLPRDRIVPFDTNLQHRLQQDIRVEPEDKEEFDMCVAEAEIERQQRAGPLSKQTMTAAPASLRAILPQNSHSLKVEGSRSASGTHSHGASSSSSRNGESHFRADAGMSSINALASVAVNASSGPMPLNFDDDKEEDGLVLPEPTVRDWTYLSFAEKQREEKEALELQRQQQAMSAQASLHASHSQSVDQSVADNVTYLRCPSPDVLESLLFHSTPDQIPMSWLGQERFYATRSGHFSQHSYLTEVASNSQQIEATAMEIDPQNIEPEQPMHGYDGHHQPRAAIPVVHGEQSEMAENPASGIDTLQHVAASVISNEQLQNEDDIILPDPNNLADITGIGGEFSVVQETTNHAPQVETQGDNFQQPMEYEEKAEMAVLPPFIDTSGTLSNPGAEDAGADVELPDVNLLDGIDLGDEAGVVDTNFTTPVEPLPDVLSAIASPSDATGSLSLGEMMQ